MTLPSLCIERPVMTTLLTLAIVLVGSVGYVFLPVAALPPCAKSELLNE